MQLGVAIQPVGPDGDGSLTARNSELAERLGFDHLIMGSRVLDTSVGSAKRAGRAGPGQGWAARVPERSTERVSSTTR